MEHVERIKAIAAKLCETGSVRALFLAGSYGAGFEDHLSDIDFLAVFDGEDNSAFAPLWREALRTVGDLVLWRERPGRNLLINAVSAEWLRIDVQTVQADGLSGRTQDGLKVLFDHDGLFVRLPEKSSPPSPDPARLLWQIEEFIRILGLMPVVLGRKDYCNAPAGTFHLRNLLVGLLIAETAAPHRGGALHLNRLITAEQQVLLSSLAIPAPEHDAIIDAHLAFACAFLPRARALAARSGVVWPEALEAATWAHLDRELGIQRPEGCD
ncbi:nucleotidyltransferase domain-containing protein [Martelella sp. HB161492]|uniref:nucleotidyltransferase domain-containing protein n=1 Tax=Martelella sp. HB161492 TaxID=2720726 RepID=UPI0015915214|nr:nucleotidyltransferase domain-containing protein [Martelella sp. HB161492]